MMNDDDDDDDDDDDEYEALVSVIIPIYNVEKYIEKTVQSVIM